MICKQCNNAVPNDSEYCPFCGNVVQKATSESNFVSEVDKGYTYLELKEWKKAKEVFDFAIVNNDNKAKAYIGRLLAKLKLTDLESISNINKKLTKFDDFKMAVKYADESYKQQLKKCYSLVEERMNQKKAKTKKRLIISSIFGASLVALLASVYFVFVPYGRYLSYEKSLSKGEVQKAVKSYTDSKWFEYDSKVEKLFYNNSIAFLESKDYKNAEKCFEISKKDEKINEILYKEGVSLVEAKDYINAEEYFRLAEDYADSKKYHIYCKAQNLLAKDDLESYNYFTKCKDFLDSKNILETNEYFVLVNKLQGEWEMGKYVGEVKKTSGSGSGTLAGKSAKFTGSLPTYEINGTKLIGIGGSGDYTLILLDKKITLKSSGGSVSGDEFKIINDKTIKIYNYNWNKLE